MKKRSPLIIAAVATTCCTLSICIPLAIFGPSIFHILDLPVYKFEQVPSAHEGYRRTILTSKNAVYVRDYEEYPLLAINTAPSEMIGRFSPFFNLDGSELYAIPGQDPSAYVLEFNPMYLNIFRNINHPPFDWLNADFQKLRVVFPAANPKETEDTTIIRNVRTTLIGAAIMVVPFQQDGNFDGYENYAALLFSDELPGMMYAAGLHIAPDGSVYLAENTVSNIWHPAGITFRDWLRDE